MTREVLLLGAGFSVVASGGKLPVTAELGRRATARAKIPRSRLPAGGFGRGRFETWLSRLAEDQPHHSVTAKRLWSPSITTGWSKQPCGR
jgi:hypothetical protein